MSKSITVKEALEMGLTKFKTKTSLGWSILEIDKTKKALNPTEISVINVKTGSELSIQDSREVFPLDPEDELVSLVSTEIKKEVPKVETPKTDTNNQPELDKPPVEKRKKVKAPKVPKQPKKEKTEDIKKYLSFFKTPHTKSEFEKHFKLHPSNGYFICSVKLVKKLKYLSKDKDRKLSLTAAGKNFLLE